MLSQLFPFMRNQLFPYVLSQLYPFVLSLSKHLIRSTLPAFRQAQGERIWLSLHNTVMLLGDGGAERNRTADLYNAIVALSQLSYSPALPTISVSLFVFAIIVDDFCKVRVIVIQAHIAHAFFGIINGQVVINDQIRFFTGFRSSNLNRLGVFKRQRLL
jgi:hypothetical protein